MISRQATVLVTLVTLPLLVELGCESDNVDVANPATTGVGAGVTTNSAQGGSGATGGTSSSGGNTSASGGTGAGGDIPPPPTEQVQCLNKLYDCGDLIDNDGDGLIDYQDPDCLGPCDNTEDSLFPDLPGDSGQKCGLDCFWDTGQGSDWNCYWDHQCDPKSLPTNDPIVPQAECEWAPQDPNSNDPVATQQENSTYSSFSSAPGNATCGSLYAAQDQECLDKCLPLAPNGCDCFGCCDIGGTTVWLGTLDTDDVATGGAGGAPLGEGTCTLESLGTPEFLENCHPCTQVPGCLNDCGPCELCLGKTTLPPECFPGEGGAGGTGGAPQDCPEGLAACGLPGQEPCGSDEYCITGCCVPIPK